MPFTVRVINDEGRGVQGRRVVLSFTSSARGQSNPQFTDHDGRARFSGFQPGEIRVYVDGGDCGTFSLAEGATVHVTRES
jgi:hypothetical protein